MKNDTTSGVPEVMGADARWGRGATPRQLKAGGLALLAGAVLYGVALLSPAARRLHIKLEHP